MLQAAMDGTGDEGDMTALIDVIVVEGQDALCFWTP